MELYQRLEENFLKIESIYFTFVNYPTRTTNSNSARTFTPPSLSALRYLPIKGRQPLAGMRKIHFPPVGVQVMISLLHDPEVYKYELNFISLALASFCSFTRTVLLAGQNLFTYSALSP